MRIGVIDSGIGGITTLRELMRAVDAEYYYYMDNANVPYGEKNTAQLMDLARESMKYMYNMDAIVIACNTLSGTVGEELRACYDVPIVLIEPSIKPATKNGDEALLIATNATINSRKFARLLSKYPHVRCIGSSTLAEFIEKSDISSAKSEIDRLLSSVDSSVNIVLGCTHYVYLKSYIESLGYKVYEGNIGVANRLREVTRHLLHSGVGSSVFVHSTAGVVDIQRITRLIGRPICFW